MIYYILLLSFLVFPGIQHCFPIGFAPFSLSCILHQERSQARRERPNRINILFYLHIEYIGLGYKYMDYAYLRVYIIFFKNQKLK